jgi:hypothetical protein
VVVNPYVVENMLFRFDNIFMMLALLCSLLSAYISMANDSRNLPLQVIFLLGSLFLYQGALSAYFVILLYLLIEKVSLGEQPLSWLKSVRYWIYTMFCTAILYLPIIYNVNYVFRNQKKFEGKKLSEYGQFVLRKISGYLENLYVDWHCTTVGVLIFVFILGFIVYFLMVAWKHKANSLDFVKRSVLLGILFFFFFLSPAGITILFNHAGVTFHSWQAARMLYSIGVLVPIVLTNASLFFEKIIFLRVIYKIFAVVFLVWNMTFANLVGNLVNQKFSLQNDISKDIANDLYYIRKNHLISEIAIKYSLPFSNAALASVLKEYPILLGILGSQWCMPPICNVLLKYNDQWCPLTRPASCNDLKNNTKLVDRMWYALYTKGNTLLIELKASPFRKDSWKFGTAVGCD